MPYQYTNRLPNYIKQSEASKKEAKNLEADEIAALNNLAIHGLPKKDKKPGKNSLDQQSKHKNGESNHAFQHSMQEQLGYLGFMPPKNQLNGALPNPYQQQILHQQQMYGQGMPNGYNPMLNPMAQGHMQHPTLDPLRNSQQQGLGQGYESMVQGLEQGMSMLAVQDPSLNPLKIDKGQLSPSHQQYNQQPFKNYQQQQMVGNGQARFEKSKGQMLKQQNAQEIIDMDNQSIMDQLIRNQKQYFNISNPPGPHSSQGFQQQSPRHSSYHQQQSPKASSLQDPIQRPSTPSFQNPYPVPQRPHTPQQDYRSTDPYSSQYSSYNGTHYNGSYQQNAPTYSKHQQQSQQHGLPLHQQYNNGHQQSQPGSARHSQSSGYYHPFDPKSRNSEEIGKGGSFVGTKAHSDHLRESPGKQGHLEGQNGGFLKNQKSNSFNNILGWGSNKDVVQPSTPSLKASGQPPSPTPTRSSSTYRTGITSQSPRHQQRPSSPFTSNIPNPYSSNNSTTSGYTRPETPQFVRSQRQLMSEMEQFETDSNHKTSVFEKSILNEREKQYRNQTEKHMDQQMVFIKRQHNRILELQEQQKTATRDMREVGEIVKVLQQQLKEKDKQNDLIVQQYEEFMQIPVKWEHKGKTKGSFGMGFSSTKKEILDRMPVIRETVKDIEIQRDQDHTALINKKLQDLLKLSQMYINKPKSTQPKEENKEQKQQDYKVLERKSPQKKENRNSNSSPRKFDI